MKIEYAQKGILVHPLYNSSVQIPIQKASLRNLTFHKKENLATNSRQNSTRKKVARTKCVLSLSENATLAYQRYNVFGIFRLDYLFSEYSGTTDSVFHLILQ